MLSNIRKDIKSSIASLYSDGVDLSCLNIFYDVSWIILSLYQSEDCQIWCRNSYHFGNYIPGLSDIDISVRSQDKPIDFLMWKDTLKKLFPWIGEVNWYPDLIADEMCALCNKVELSRDPILLKKFSNAGFKATDIDRFIFLVRMIDYDKIGLKLNPKSRTRKWAYHWNLVRNDAAPSQRDCFIRDLSMDSVIALACEFVPSEKRDEIKETLKSVFYNDLRCDWLMPHKFLNLYDFNVSECELYFPEATQAQINWEFWGVCTQAFWLPKESFHEHLQKLNKINNPNSTVHDQQARQKILEYVEKNF